MKSHSYGNRNNFLASKENGPENSTEISPEISSDNRSATFDTCKLIINLEKNILTRFHGFDKELLNRKNAI